MTERGRARPVDLTAELAFRRLDALRDLLRLTAHLREFRPVEPGSASPASAGHDGRAPTEGGPQRGRAARTVPG